MPPAVRAVLSVLLFGVASCRAGNQAELSEAQRTHVSSAVREVVDSAFAAIVRVDPPALMRTFAAGPEATFSGDGVIVAGHDSISRFFQAALATWRAVDSASLQNVRVAVLGPDAAVVTANYRERVTDKAGAVFWNAGAWTSTIARRDGQWKVVDAHASHPRVAP